MSSARPLLGAYYYPGWHPCPVRDSAFAAGFSEWDLVYRCRPRFEGHEQPNLPAWGPLDESQPEVFARKVEAARAHGLDFFCFAFYWSRGKQLLGRALDQGLLGCQAGRSMPFALMWANRMPRKVLPVKDPAAALIDPQRLVYTDEADFLSFIGHCARTYFCRDNYLRLGGAAYLSIFDTTFFIRQLGVEGAARAIAAARCQLLAEGFGALHLAAIDPHPELLPLLPQLGFDSVTHYVWLPAWKGDYLQDFATLAEQRVRDRPTYAAGLGLPYFPSVTPGWDATPRAVDYGLERPRRYPWWPIVTGRDPALFSGFVRQALHFSCQQQALQPLAFNASFNEWSEGHYLEPDERHGYRWLEAVDEARRG